MSDAKRCIQGKSGAKEGRAATMEEAVATLDEADHAIRPNKHLVIGIAASVVLHLICTAALLGLPGGEPPRPAVTYVDLDSVPTPKPAPLPAQEALPAPEPEPKKAEPIPVPENPQAPPKAQAEQPEAAVRPSPAQPSAAEERAPTTFGMGLTKGYFKSLSDGESLRADVKGYYLEMLQGINEKWWLEQRDQQVRAIVVNLTVARNGEIVGSEIVQSSGNIVYDRAVQKSLENSGPLPPLPPTYQGEFFQAPIRLVPPLNLLAW